MLISSTFRHSLGASLSIEEAIRCSGYNLKGEKPEIVSTSGNEILYSRTVTNVIIDHLAHRTPAPAQTQHLPCTFSTHIQISIFILLVHHSLCLLSLTFWFIYRFSCFVFVVVPLFCLFLPLVASFFALAGMCGRGAVSPLCPRYIYSCDILSFCLIQLSAGIQML